MTDYWIGDQVVIKSTRQVGKFEGISPSGKFRIQIDGIHHEIDSMDVELYLEPEERSDEFLTELEEISSDHSFEFYPVIDLHIEELDPSMAQEKPHIIITYQVQKCKQFLQAAIKNQVQQVKIIHGKGSGRLKDEVLHLLRHIPEVFIIQEVHQGGAQEVILRG